MECCEEPSNGEGGESSQGGDECVQDAESWKRGSAS